MTSSKFITRKVLVPSVFVALPVCLVIWIVFGLSSAIAAVNQTINSSEPSYGQVRNITGSINAGQPVKTFIKDDLKVSFQQAFEIGVKQIANGTMMGGHVAVAQGYLVYKFFVVNAQDQT